MVKSKPKECINLSCKNTFYVTEISLGLPLQCETCINKRINGNQETKD
jgi:hypothetical protein